MLDQSFTPKNLKRVYEEANRKGLYLDQHFPPIVEELSKKLKKERGIKKRLNKKRERMDEDQYQEIRKRINENIKNLKEQKSDELDSHLTVISNRISSKKFELKLKAHETRHHTKTTYKIPNQLEHILAEKQLQRNIKKTYNVKQSNRDTIVSQLTAILGDPFPKYIMRTDIKDFYESIDKIKLQKKIDNSPQLSLSSRKMIKKVLEEHKRISGSHKGIPRGIGISAYLAELYMKETDSKLESLSDAVYYTRYVDDIIIVFSTKSDDEEKDHKTIIKEFIEETGLSLNEEKTYYKDLRFDNNFQIDYLGYKFYYTSSLKIKISNHKVEKYKKRIDLSFDSYQKGHKGKKERKDLINRIRLLTGNTKLTNNKGGAFVGIYSSNKWANDLSPFKGLDAYLSHKINSLQCKNLQKRLQKLSFEEGFKRKSFRKFSATELGKLTKPWTT